MSEGERPWVHGSRGVGWLGWWSGGLLVAVMLVGASATTAQAQLGPPLLAPVPPLPPRAALPKPPPPPPLRFEGSAQFGFVSTSGNSSTESIGLAGETFYRPGMWEVQDKVDFVRLKSEGQLKAKSLAALFRAARGRSRRLAVYGQYHFLRDLFAGIEQRHTVTGGLALKAVDAASQKLTLRAGLGVASEHRVEDGPASDPLAEPIREVETNATATQTVQYVLQVSKTSQATNDFHLDESLGAAGDWRLGNEAAFSTKINSIFSLKVSNTLRFVHEPVPGFMQTDTVTSISVVAKF